MSEAATIEISDYELHTIPTPRDGVVEVRAATWEAWELPGNVFEFMEELREILDGIPADLRANATIELDAYSDREGFPHGKAWITYSRPATERELAVDEIRKRRSVRKDVNWVKGRIAEVLESAVSAGVDPADIGITLQDGNFLVAPASSGDSGN